ncbi:MAG TPA: 23S rRNA (uracil(1939)-C(5))-methyltransferase RlmD, partial [Gemmatimonadales bacterium]|nr:23S rRNA (uracil(1939)-C(5))-methyltransferase RlmD [Gemmatimonadales bacterium]
GRVIGRVEEVTGQLRPADSAIVNPPRTGLGGEATDRLNARPPERLVYVSCDPATLARDLARLTSAYRLTDLRAFDLFPQTAHVETVATLERR